MYVTILIIHLKKLALILGRFICSLSKSLAISFLLGTEGYQVIIVSTPGHSIGAQSFFFDVKGESETYSTVILGGLGMFSTE